MDHVPESGLPLGVDDVDVPAGGVETAGVDGNEEPPVGACDTFERAGVRTGRGARCAGDER